MQSIFEIMCQQDGGGFATVTKTPSQAYAFRGGKEYTAQQVHGTMLRAV